MCFLGIGPLDFSEIQHGARSLMKLCVAEPDYLEKPFLRKKMGKRAENMSKIGFLEFKEKLVINFF